MRDRYIRKRLDPVARILRNRHIFQRKTGPAENIEIGFFEGDLTSQRRFQRFPNASAEAGGIDHRRYKTGRNQQDQRRNQRTNQASYQAKTSRIRMRRNGYTL